MRKTAAALLTLSALFSIISFAATPFPRHVDPAQIPEEKPPIELLLLYSQIGDYALQLNLQKAFEYLSNARYAYIPKDLAYLFERFNSLLNETMTNMNNTKQDLTLCRKLLEESKIAPAEESLKNALKNLILSKIDYHTLEDASRELSRLVTPHPINRAVSGVAGGISKLEDEAEELNSTLYRLKPRLLNVRLEISVEPRFLLFGQSFHVKGSLTGEDGSTLGGRVVVLHVGGRSYNLETSQDGSYRATCYALEYSSLTVFTEYIPRGEDVGRYSYAASEIILVNVTYYTPQLKLSLSKDRALPGETITVRVDTVPRLYLKLDTPWSGFSGTSDETGSLSYSLTIPPNAKEGSYTIYASTLPKGLYSPVKVSRRLTVYRLETAYSISTPKIVFTGIPFTVEVEVDTNSTINLYLSGLNATYTHHGLRFSSTHTLPLTFLPGSLTASVRITPDSPTYRAVYAESEITVVNTPAVAIPTALILAFSIRLFKKRVEAQLVEETPKRAEAGLELKPKPKIYTLFSELVTLLEKLYGVFMKPSDTLREYLSKVEPKIHSQFKNTVRDAFERYERLIYGRPEEGLEGLISQLLTKLLEGFRRVFKL
jgi:hypothetical protein